MERAPVYGIEVFLTIVREGSLRAAADALGVGAPAVSLQLKSLEEKNGRRAHSPHDAQYRTH
ncbi:helix-turn-helix domain-containing protein [Aliiroseovarius sp.]|uniref:helix-turn-helix domain-containing protein n=1 Tax=Aliiroseovarius sp. TaxID=1872442 RepID=UPI003BAC037A